MNRPFTGRHMLFLMLAFIYDINQMLLLDGLYNSQCLTVPLQEVHAFLC